MWGAERPHRKEACAGLEHARHAVHLGGLERLGDELGSVIFGGQCGAGGLVRYGCTHPEVEFHIA